MIRLRLHVSMSTNLCAHDVCSRGQSGQGGRPTAGGIVTVADRLTIQLLMCTGIWLQGPWSNQSGGGGRGSRGCCCNGDGVMSTTTHDANYDDIGIQDHTILIVASPHSDCDPRAVAYELQMIKGRTWGHTLHLIVYVCMYVSMLNV